MEKEWTERGVPDDMGMRLILGVALGRLVSQGLARDIAHAYMDAAFDLLPPSVTEMQEIASTLDSSEGIVDAGNGHGPSA